MRSMAVGWPQMTYIHAKLRKKSSQLFQKLRKQRQAGRQAGRQADRQADRQCCDLIHLPSSLKLSSLFMKKIQFSCTIVDTHCLKYMQTINCPAL
jgi:hypothetical protein